MKFFVKLPSKSQDPSGMYKKSFLQNVFTNHPHLTDDNTNRYTYGGIHNPYTKDISYAGPNDGFVFGKSPYDVQYSSYGDILRNTICGEAPVYDLYSQYDEAVNAVRQYAQRNRYYNNYLPNYYGGQYVYVGDGYIRVGNNIIPTGLGVRQFSSLSYTRRVEITTVIVKIRKTIIIG